MNNLYTVYTPEEIDIFKSLSPLNESISATSKMIEISKKIPLFKEIPENVLIKILKDIKIIKYKKDEVIIKENDIDDTMFFILLNSVNVVKNNILITTLQKNNLIGEMASLLNQKRTASIIAAQTPTLVLAFKIDFTLIHTDLGYYFSILYKNLSIELAKKLLLQDNKIVNK